MNGGGGRNARLIFGGGVRQEVTPDTFEKDFKPFFKDRGLDRVPPQKTNDGGDGSWRWEWMVVMEMAVVVTVETNRTCIKQAAGKRWEWGVTVFAWASQAFYTPKRIPGEGVSQLPRSQKGLSAVLRSSDVCQSLQGNCRSRACSTEEVLRSFAISDSLSDTR